MSHRAAIFAAWLGSVLFAGAAVAPAKQVVPLRPIPPVGLSPITADCRYLFVVDTSAAMTRYADGLYRTTHRLVATGLGGRMQEGDVFTVWTYAEAVLTREFPLNAWQPELNVALANRTYEYLATQKFSGKSNLRPVFAELGQALAIATNLTIILISDGTDVVVGTPFDRPINVTYGKRANELRTAKMPFVTALVAQQGEFTHWSVRGGLEDINLPMPVRNPFPVPPLVEVPAPKPRAPEPAPPVSPPTPPIVVAPAPKPVVTNSISVPVPAVRPPTPPVAVPVVVAAAPRTNSSPAQPAPPPAVPVPAISPKPAMPAVVQPPPLAPAPKAVTNAVASVTPAPKLEAKANPVPKPAPKPAMELPKAPETAPKPVPKSLPPTVASPPPNAPKAEVKTPSPPPKPVAVPELKTLPAPVAQAKEVLLQPLIPPVLRPPRSGLDASNALAKIELLRPLPTVATSAPPVRPLEARVVELKPAPPAKTNPPAPVAKVALPAPPTAKPATNIAAGPVTPSKPASVTPVERKVVLVPTNSPVRTNLPATTARALPVAGVVSNNVAMTAANSVPPSAKRAVVRPEAKVSPATNQPAKPIGSLAITSPKANSGGWVYLIAAVVLLAVAGGIISYLLRPQPTPSAISQSLDSHRK